MANAGRSTERSLTVTRYTDIGVHWGPKVLDHTEHLGFEHKYA